MSSDEKGRVTSRTLTGLNTFPKSMPEFAPGADACYARHLLRAWKSILSPAARYAGLTLLRKVSLRRKGGGALRA